MRRIDEDKVKREAGGPTTADIGMSDDDNDDDDEDDDSEEDEVAI